MKDQPALGRRGYGLERTDSALGLYTTFPDSAHACCFFVFFDCTHVLVPKKLKNVAQVLHNNKAKFPKDFFAIVLSTNLAAITNMAVVTSDAIKELC